MGTAREAILEEAAQFLYEKASSVRVTPAIDRGASNTLDFMAGIIESCGDAVRHLAALSSASEEGK